MHISTLFYYTRAKTNVDYNNKESWFKLQLTNTVVQHVNVKKEIWANIFLLTRPCGPLENAPRAKPWPADLVCAVPVRGVCAHLSVMVGGQFADRARQLSHLHLLVQLALEAREHHLALARLQTCSATSSNLI